MNEQSLFDQPRYSLARIREAMGVPRARGTDPGTSKAAAETARDFAATHAGRILAVIRAEPGLIPAQIAERTGLTYHAVQRRLKEIETAGLIFPAGESKGQRRWWTTEGAGQ